MGNHERAWSQATKTTQARPGAKRENLRRKFKKRKKRISLCFMQFRFMMLLTGILLQITERRLISNLPI